MKIDEKKWKRFDDIVDFFTFVITVFLYSEIIEEHIPDKFLIQLFGLVVFVVIMSLLKDFVLSVIRQSVFLNVPFRVKEEEIEDTNENSI